MRPAGQRAAPNLLLQEEMFFDSEPSCGALRKLDRKYMNKYTERDRERERERERERAIYIYYLFVCLFIFSCMQDLGQ